MSHAQTREVLALWRQIRESGESAVLATVIGVEGSSYRSPGARLLLTSDGRRAGSVSGGCLEDDLVRRGWWLTESGSTIRAYDSSGEDGTYGLGCNGIVHVHLQRLSTEESSTALDRIAEVWRTRQPKDFPHPVPRPHLAAFTETITPPTRVLIFGAGYDAVAIQSQVQMLGWEAHVYDGRAHYARPERFPSANVVEVREGGNLDGIAFDPWTVAVLMSHSLEQDRANLRALLPQPLSYLGVLGPRRRTEQMLCELGVDSPPDNLYSPIGLDLGADGPEQVALATVAEIQSVLRGRKGGQLRNAAGSIHQCA